MVEHKTLNERYYEIQLTAIDKYLNLSISQIFMGQNMVARKCIFFILKRFILKGSNPS